MYTQPRPTSPFSQVLSQEPTRLRLWQLLLPGRFAFLCKAVQTRASTPPSAAAALRLGPASARSAQAAASGMGNTSAAAGKCPQRPAADSPPTSPSHPERRRPQSSPHLQHPNAAAGYGPVPSCAARRRRLVLLGLLRLPGPRPSTRPRPGLPHRRPDRRPGPPRPRPGSARAVRPRPRPGRRRDRQCPLSPPEWRRAGLPELRVCVLPPARGAEGEPLASRAGRRQSSRGRCKRTW